MDTPVEEGDQDEDAAETTLREEGQRTERTRLRIRPRSRSEKDEVVQRVAAWQSVALEATRTIQQRARSEPPVTRIPRPVAFPPDSPKPPRMVFFSADDEEEERIVSDTPATLKRQESSSPSNASLQVVESREKTSSSSSPAMPRKEPLHAVTDHTVTERTVTERTDEPTEVHHHHPAVVIPPQPPVRPIAKQPKPRRKWPWSRRR